MTMKESDSYSRYRSIDEHHSGDKGLFLRNNDECQQRRQMNDRIHNDHLYCEIWMLVLPFFIVLF